ncbi:MAG: transketolase C-terminal domain-containing protein, partial [Acidobacteriota bacterium]
GYGISVPNEHQITKSDLSALLSGFARTDDNPQGFQVFTVRGWDYPSLVAVYQQAADVARREHVPAIIHVIELTQPQGHSTSGSHERYKSPERLAWEEENDGLAALRSLILDRGWGSEEELQQIEAEAKDAVNAAKRSAWSYFMDPIQAQVAELVELLQEAAATAGVGEEAAAEVATLVKQLKRIQAPWRRNLMSTGRDAILALHDAPEAARRRLLKWLEAVDRQCAEKYGRYLHAEGERSALEVAGVEPVYPEDAPELNGFEVLNHCFDAALGRHPELVAFGEDLGQLGDVNQGFRGLQEKYGALRVADVGIRECTILGQAIGLAMRGMRPLAEIQYLDYLHYALQIISDDLATVRWRSAGRQQAPVIIRTRGHRFEGIWHSGSPMAGILGLVRGIFLCVPRDMTQAAGMYNTLLRSDDSAIVIEVLNGYRRKERLPSNIAEFSVPLGVPEVLKEGDDCTVVTYGACCRVALDAAAKLARVGIEVEIIDVQTLLPFDTDHRILSSVKKTGRLLLLDEDVPGGATAFMQQKIVEEQGAFHWLDAPPRSVTAAEHRPAYASDGDYWSKPNAETIFDAVYAMMHEADRRRFPLFTAANS